MNFGCTISQAFRVGDCTIDRNRGRIVRPDGATHVEPRAMDLLVELAKRAGRTASREELIHAVWGHAYITDEALSRCVSLVRQALGDERTKPRFVETIPKRGYRLLAAVSGLEGEHALSTPTMLAVLPFVNLSCDTRNEHVADGLTELLITHLANVPSLRVVSRTSSMHYKYTRRKLADIARELNVTRLVEGSVLRSERTMQVVVQLIDPGTDTHVFSRMYARKLGDTLEAQNDVARSIVKDLCTLFGATPASD